MIPLGVLGSAFISGVIGVPESDLTFLESRSSPSVSAEPIYTHTAVALGPPSTYRTIILTANLRGSMGAEYPTVTINGYTLKPEGQSYKLGAADIRQYIYSGIVPDGTIGDVVITLATGNTTTQFIGVWSATGPLSVVGTSTSSAAPMVLSPAVEPGGCVVATAGAGQTSMEWEGATEQYEYNNVFRGSGASVKTNTSIPVSISVDSAGTWNSAVAVAYKPYPFGVGVYQKVAVRNPVGGSVTFPVPLTPGNLLVVMTTATFSAPETHTLSHGLSYDYSQNHQGWYLSLASAVVQSDVSKTITVTGLPNASHTNVIAWEVIGADHFDSGGFATGSTTYTVSAESSAPGIGFFASYLSNTWSPPTTSTGTIDFGPEMPNVVAGHALVPEPGLVSVTNGWNTFREHRLMLGVYV